jgi:hypothetical protein
MPLPPNCTHFWKGVILSQTTPGALTVCCAPKASKLRPHFDLQVLLQHKLVDAGADLAEGKDERLLARLCQQPASEYKIICPSMQHSYLGVTLNIAQ